MAPLAPPLRIAVTLGDPAGVGPDLVVSALAADGEQGVRVFGDARVIERAAERAGKPVPSQIEAVSALADVEPGRPDARTGAAQVAYLEAAVRAILRGEFDALVTAPNHKAACKAAGFSFPGHTEFLAQRLGAPHVVMMLAGPHLRVVPATSQIGVAGVPAALARASLPPLGDGSLAETLCMTAASLHRQFRLARPRVAVAALNPHAGESGLFGDEEERFIRPAIDEAARRLTALSIPAELSGPHVPDAIYRAAAAPPFGDGRYDAVVGMYHDQALIPVKLVDFDDAVNVTLGLPIVRTSPDHGVAYDVAGTSRVRDGSFRAALRLARTLATKS